MSSPEFCSGKSCHDGNARHANSNANRTQTANGDSSAASKPVKGQTCLQDGSRDRPIIIDDSVTVPLRPLPVQGPRNQTHRIRKRNRDHRRALPSVHKPSPMHTYNRLEELLRSSHKVVVISGAGISSNAGFPTFSEMRKSKLTSFDRSLYASSAETTRFHSTLVQMHEHLQSNTTMPTPFHMLMDELARDGRLRHYTQNIDCVERGLPHLEARTVRLHGRVDRARCQLCNWVCDSEPRSFQGGTHLLECQRCSRRNQAREIEGKRSLSIGRLRPDVLLYGEPHLDDKEIIKAVKEDLRVRPKLVLVVGTTLKVPGARSIAANLCQAARSHALATPIVKPHTTVPSQLYGTVDPTVTYN